VNFPLGPNPQHEDKSCHELILNLPRAAPSWRAAGALSVVTAANAGAITERFYESPKGAEADPIFAALERHQAACHVFDAAVKAYGIVDGVLELDDPEYIAAHNEEGRACHEHAAALAGILSVEPTSTAGIIALLEHLSQPEFLDPRSDENIFTSIGRYQRGVRKAAALFPAVLARSLRSIHAVRS